MKPAGLLESLLLPADRHSVPSAALPPVLPGPSATLRSHPSAVPLPALGPSVAPLPTPGSRAVSPHHQRAISAAMLWDTPLLQISASTMLLIQRCVGTSSQLVSRTPTRQSSASSPNSDPGRSFRERGTPLRYAIRVTVILAVGCLLYRVCE